MLGPEDSAKAAGLMRQLRGKDAEVLDGASHTWLVLARPYRTPFTLLLTFIGHRPLVSFPSVIKRAVRKRFQHADDIPTIGYLHHLHLGILADGMERANFYDPVERGFERDLKKRLDYFSRLRSSRET